MIGNVVRPNRVPRKNYRHKNPPKLVTVALISPMKRVKEVLESLHYVKFDVVYHLYGPVQDADYFKLCTEIADRLPNNVTFNYLGAAEPERVPEILGEYDFYIQPSESENFGHSIFEALSIGLPVITSRNTPWRDLEQQFAGWNVTSVDEIQEAISVAASVSEEDYIRMSAGAREVADKYVRSQDNVRAYEALFNS